MFPIWQTVAAITGVLAIGATAGHFVTNQLFEERKSVLESKLASQQKVSGIDVEAFFDRLIQLDQSLGEKEQLRASVVDLESQVSNLMDSVDVATISLSRLEKRLELEISEKVRLQHLIEEDFEELGELSVSEHDSVALVPGKVYLSVGMILSNSAWLTVTDSVTNRQVQEGERIPVIMEGKDCSVILTGVFHRKVAVTYACLNK